ncbi:MAG: glutamate-1-semialdehyde 2,1-aminomutase [Bdellovibrionales bacterium]
MNTMNSEELFARSLKVAPGGVHSPVRAFRSVGGTPIFFARAEGPYIESVEGKRYLDFCQSFGPNLLGHRDPDVEKVLLEAVRTGWCFGTCEPYSLELAELIQSSLPWVDKIRFVCSGTEAVMSALRVARAATGKQKVLKFEGCYHGHADPLLVKAGSGLAGPSAADSAGISAEMASHTLVAPLDDEEAFDRVLNEHADNMAAVILEPLPANYGLLIQRESFLKHVVELSRAKNILVIFDEVISGFRVAWGGMAERTGLRPDLVTYGKVIGGGLAVGAYAGRDDLMNLVAPAGPVYQAGTLSANPLAMMAGLATLKKAQKFGVFEGLEKRTSQFCHELRPILKAAQMDVSNVGSLFWIHPVAAKPLRSLRDLPADMGERFKRFYHSCLSKGIYLAPSAFEVGFLSWAHSDQVLSDTLGRFREAVNELAK